MSKNSEFFTQALVPRLRDMEDTNVRTLIQELLQYSSDAEKKKKEEEIEPPEKPKVKPASGKPEGHKDSSYFEALLNLQDLQETDPELTKILEDLLSYTKSCESGS